MDISGWWPLLSEQTRTWLMQHNGEPLPDAVLAEVLNANGGATHESWWAGESTDGQSQLTDEAIDWIEATANYEKP